MSRRRRLGRILLNAATLGSGVAGAVAAVLWARGARAPHVPGPLYGTPARCDRLELAGTDFVGPRRRQRCLWLSSHSGAFHVDWISNVRRDPRPPEAQLPWAPSPWQARTTWGGTVDVSDWERGRAGFRLRRFRATVQTPRGLVARDDFGASVPCWAAVPALATPPALWLHARRRRRCHRLAGRCLECGYDLRATPAPPHRCPECGTAAAAASPADG